MFSAFAKVLNKKLAKIIIKNLEIRENGCNFALAFGKVFEASPT